MTPETVARIREYYRPEFGDSGRTLVLHPPNRPQELHPSWIKKYLLTFGEQPAPKTLEEGLARGFLQVTGRELFAALLSPEEFEAIRATKELDPRTAAYLKATKKGIGLSGRRDGYDAEKFEPAAKVDLGIGPDCWPVQAEIGRLADGRWVAEWSVRTAIDDYCITDLYFDHQPTASQVHTAIFVDKIEFELSWKRRFNPAFECWECGRKCAHWLDITASSLQAQWEAFQESYCGC